MALTIRLENYLSTQTPVELTLPDNALARNLTEIYTDQFDLGGANKYERVDLRNQTMIEYYIERATKALPGVSLHMLTGVTLKSLPSRRKHQPDKVLVTGWFNNQAYHTAPLSLNLIHNALLMQRTNNNSYRLTITNHPLPFDLFMRVEAANSKDGDGSIGFKIGNTLVLGMSFLAASFVIFLGSFILFCYHCLFD